MRTIAGDLSRAVQILPSSGTGPSETASLQRPPWISRRASLVVEERSEWSIRGEARVGSRRIARILWTHDGQLDHVMQLDAAGKGHGLEIEIDDGRVKWCAQWVHGKQHGLAIQFDERGRPLFASRFVRGRGADIWMNCGSLSEVREMQDGRLHGWVRWGDPEQPWEEEHYLRSQRHGIFRTWDDGKLKRGSPQFYIRDERVPRRAYLAAQARDASLPRYDPQDDANRRTLLPVIQDALARAKRLRRDSALLTRVRRLNASLRGDASPTPAARSPGVSPRRSPRGKAGEVSRARRGKL